MQSLEQLDQDGDCESRTATLIFAPGRGGFSCVTALTFAKRSEVALVQRCDGLR